jgi:hypothetical protein
VSVPLVGPDGKEYDFEGSPEQLEAAKAQGFRVAADIGFAESALDTAKATALSAAEGLTGGLLGGGLGARQGDEETPESAQARWRGASEMMRLREEHPVASTVGELGGMVLSPINKAGALVRAPLGATTTLGRIGANVAEGATSGLLFGAGKTVSDAALGDVDLTAEKLLAGAGLGALLGGVGGGLGGAIEEGARAVLPRAMTLAKRAQSALDDIANDATISSTRATQAALKNFTDDELQTAAKVMRERGHFGTPEKLGELVGKDRDAVEATLLKELGLDVGGLGRRMDRDTARAALETGTSRYGEKIGGALKEIDELGWARPEFSKFRQRFDSFREGLNAAERDNIKGALRRVQGFLDDMGSQPVGSKKNNFSALNDLKSTLQKEINYKVEDNVRIGLKKQLVGILRDEIDSQIAAQVGGRMSDDFVAAKKAFGALSRADDALGRQTATGGDAIDALLKDSGHVSPNVDIYRALGTAERLAESGAGRAGGMGLKDLLAGDLLGHFASPFGIIGAIGSKVLREQGPAIAARIADKLAKEPALQAMAKSFAASLPATAPKLGPYGAVLAQEAAVSPERALATHMAYAQLDPSYAATAQLAGLTPELPDEQPVALARAQTLAEAQAAAAAQDEAVKKGVDRVARGGGSPSMGSALKSQDFGAMRMRRDGAAAYDKRVTEIRELATDPAALVDRITANMTGLGESAPGVTAAMTSTAMRAVQYLAQQSAVPPKAGPMAAEWDPPEADRQAFAEKLEVVQDPMSVLKSAQAGTLTEGELEALRAVYPRLAQQMADAALERMVSGGSVPYAQRLMLGMLSGVDPDGSMSPEAIAANQAAIAAAKQPVAPVAPVGNEASDVTLATRTATPGQRREVRDE